MIELDVPNRRLNLLVSPDTIAQRLAARPPATMHYRRGYGWLFAQHILQADKGCDFDFLRAEAHTTLEHVTDGRLGEPPLPRSA
jgi:dihydroxy-acid dehydratase